MARKRAPGLIKSLAAAAALLSDERRFLDMRLEFRNHAGDVLLSAGGRWDFLTRAWAQASDGPEVWTPQDGWGKNIVLRRQDFAAAGRLCPAHVVVVEPSQEEYTCAFGDYLYALYHDLPRPTALDLLAGNRRGGKTWIMVACVIAAALALPWRRDKDGLLKPFVGWLIVPSYPEQREIHEDLLAVLRERDGAPALPAGEEARESLDVVATGIQKTLPRQWFTYRPNPNNCYVFRHGAELYLKSAKLADSLKQGRVSVIGVNEAQKIEGDAVIHAMGNNIDDGGLTILAANPPRSHRGQWLLDLKQRWDENYFIDPEDGQQVMRMFRIKPEKNTRINQPSRRKFAMVAEVINPRLARADADAEWDAIYDLAYLKWVNKTYPDGNIIDEIPPAWQDVTREVIGAMGLREYRRHPSQFTEFAGLDFNKYPWMAAAKLRAFRDHERTDPRTGKPVVVYVVIDEARTDPDLGMFATEEEFSDELMEGLPDGYGWSPQQVLIVADASGQWQNSQERKKGGVEAGHSSFDLFEGAGWEIHAPTTIKMKRKDGGVGRRTWYRPPRVLESQDKVNELLAFLRLLVLRRCGHVCEAFKKCAANERTGKTDDRLFSHITDAVRYAVWRAEAGINPKKGAPPPIGPRRRSAGASLVGGKNWMG